MKNSEKAGFYPILINLNRFNCIIVGGGKVAYRKILSLLKFKAEITVISPQIIQPILKLAGLNKVKIIKKSYSSKYIKGCQVVFSATDNQKINERVRRDCTKKGILLNVVDNPALCDFILPANVQRGDLTISVSSQGKAPFFTKEMKKKIEELVSPVYKQVFNMAGKLRQEVLSDPKLTAKARTKVFSRFSSNDWEKILKTNGKHSSKYYINKILRELNLL